MCECVCVCVCVCVCAQYSTVKYPWQPTPYSPASRSRSAVVFVVVFLDVRRELRAPRPAGPRFPSMSPRPHCVTSLVYCTARSVIISFGGRFLHNKRDRPGRPPPRGSQETGADLLRGSLPTPSSGLSRHAAGWSGRREREATHSPEEGTGKTVCERET